MLKKLLVTMILFSLLLSSCTQKEEEVPELLEPVNSGVDTAVVSRGDIYELSTYDANVYPEIQEISFSTDGRIDEVAVFTGQEVKKGDLLASYDDEHLTSELSSLKEELDNSKKNNEYENQMLRLDLEILELTIRKMESDQAAEIDIAVKEAERKELELSLEQKLSQQELMLEQIEKKIADREEALAKMQITAPCSGMIAYVKPIGIGDRVKAYDPVVLITDDTKLHIQSNYIEAGVIESASQVYALIHGKEYAISYIPLELKDIMEMGSSSSIETKFSFEPDGIVKTGDYACICVKSKLKTDVINIPIKSLFHDTDGDFVYLMVDDKLERCSVETGEMTEIQVEIVNGLAEGDVVYVQE